MKQIISNLYQNKYFLYCLLLIIFTSCITEPIENHKGGIICLKQNPNSGRWFKIKYKNKDSLYDYKSIYVEEIDWNKYQIGDTIK